MKEKRCKNVNIVDLFTDHYDSLTELNAQGMNAEVRLRRRDHECCFTAQTCVRGPGPSLHKMIFANDKGCDDNVKEKQIRPPLGEMCRL